MCRAHGWTPQASGSARSFLLREIGKRRRDKAGMLVATFNSNMHAEPRSTIQTVVARRKRATRSVPHRRARRRKSGDVDNTPPVKPAHRRHTAMTVFLCDVLRGSAFPREPFPDAEIQSAQIMS